MSTIQSGFSTQFQPAQSRKRKRLGNISPSGAQGGGGQGADLLGPLDRLRNIGNAAFPNRFLGAPNAQSQSRPGTTTARRAGNQNTAEGFIAGADPFVQAAADALGQAVAEANANSREAVDILGGAIDTSFTDNPFVADTLGSIQNSILNPDVLDDQTVAFLQTRNRENINRLADSNQDEFVELQAARGTLNSGDALNAARNIGASKARQITEGERDIEIQRNILREQNRARAQALGLQGTGFFANEDARNDQLTQNQAQIVDNLDVADLSELILGTGLTDKQFEFETEQNRLDREANEAFGNQANDAAFRQFFANLILPGAI